MEREPRMLGMLLLFSSRKLTCELASFFDHLPPMWIQSRWELHPIFEASQKIIVSTGGRIMSLPFV